MSASAVEVAHDGLELAALVQQLAAVAKPRGARARALEEARDERRVARTASVLHRQQLEPRERFVPDRSGRPLVASREDTEALARAALQELLLELEELGVVHVALARGREPGGVEGVGVRGAGGQPRALREDSRDAAATAHREARRDARAAREARRVDAPRVDREAQARVLDDRGDCGLDLRHRAVPRVVRAGHDPAEALRGPRRELDGPRSLPARIERVQDRPGPIPRVGRGQVEGVALSRITCGGDALDHAAARHC